MPGGLVVTGVIAGTARSVKSAAETAVTSVPSMGMNLSYERK